MVLPNPAYSTKRKSPFGPFQIVPRAGPVEALSCLTSLREARPEPGKSVRAEQPSGQILKAAPWRPFKFMLPGLDSNFQPRSDGGPDRAIRR